jgi:medium-chain acyl-[acyl-carrier-protein] hydrolase
MGELSDELIKELINKIELPYVFFGHSLGALMCYEITSILASKNLKLPLHVFLSGANPPNRKIIEGYKESVDDDELAEELKKFNGIPDEILNNKDLLKVFLKSIRADISLLATYHFNNNYLFSMPLTIFGGQSDITVDCNKLKDWNHFTEGYCRILTMPGDHFFIFSEKENLLAEINRELKFLAFV